MPVVKFKEGTVTFKVEQLRGCCGVGVVYHPRFIVALEGTKYAAYGQENDHVPRDLRKRFSIQVNKLYAVFHAHVAGPRKLGHNGYPAKEWPFDLDRSRLMMTDHKGGVVYKFCTFNKWKKVKTFRNYKTGNVIYTFYLDRR